jgi:hypothetical protein
VPKVKIARIQNTEDSRQKTVDRRKPSAVSVQLSAEATKELCDKGAAKAKRNPSPSLANVMEICVAWIYQSRYIKKEDGIQKTVEKEKKKQSRKHEGTKARKRRGWFRAFVMGFSSVYCLLR